MQASKDYVACLKTVEQSKTRTEDYSVDSFA